MLTDAKIKRLAKQDKLYRVLDSDRLYIEVRVTGAKVWRYKFIMNGKERSIGLGEYPVVSLAEARQLRDEAKAMIAKKIDPVQHRRSLRTNDDTTFKSIAEEYYKLRLVDKSESYRSCFNNSMKKDVYKVIGNKNIRDVTSADILFIMNATMARISKQSNFGTGEVTAIQNRKFIGAIIRYAISTLRAEYDPTYAVKDAVEAPDVEHARPMTDDEKRFLRTKLDSYNGSRTVRNAVLAMFYSMLRTIEIRRMRWEYVDLENLTITFPISKRNSSRVTKKNRIHIVPISTQLHELLLDQYKVSGNNELVFPSVYKEGMLSATTLNRALDYVGLHDVTAHDFRATASTILNEKNYNDDWIELQLAHSSDNKTRATYNHAKYMTQRRKMMQDWCDIVDSWKK